MPSPVITLVFTDVVGSSAAKRAATLGANVSERDHVYLDAIQMEHLRVVRSAVAKFNGKEIMTMGDGFFLTFDDPVDAVRCAAAIHQRLASHPIDTPAGPLRLRVGIHVGTPKFFENSWHGTDVDIAARVQSVASPDQIVVTQAARELIGEPVGLTLRPLGTFALKGVGDVKLWDVDYDQHGRRAASLTPRERKKRLRILAFLVSACSILFGAFQAGTELWDSHPKAQTDAGTAATPHEINSIIVANFENKTGETIFDGILTQAFTTQLQQSPVLNIIGLDRLRESMKYLGKSPDDPITPAIARDIGVREGFKAYLSGSIVRLGNGYVINATAVNCANGDTLASGEANAADKDHVIEALSTVATALRTRLGESLDSIQKLDTPLGQTTTPSLEALRDYALGMSALLKGQNIPEATGFFQQAIDLDPNFAMAYLGAGAAYNNVSQYGKAVEYITKAHEHAKQVSEMERLRIEAEYDTFVTGDVHRAIDSLKLACATYPDDRGFLATLASNQSLIGDFAGAIDSGRKLLALSPGSLVAQDNLVLCLTAIDQFTEARPIADSLVQHAPGINFLSNSYVLYALTGDTAGTAKISAACHGREDEYTMAACIAASHEFQGRYAEAEREWTEGAAQAATQSAPDTQANYLLSRLDGRYLAGLPIDAAAEIKTAAALDDSKPTLQSVAYTAALCHLPNLAQPMMDKLAQQYPEDTFINQVLLPVCRAYLSLAANQPRQALHELEDTGPYDLLINSAYVRGLTCLQLNDGAGAIDAFQKATRYRGASVINSMQDYGQAQLGLARAYLLTDDKANAKKSYEALFVTWKDADADLPQLVAAKKEYAALK